MKPKAIGIHLGDFYSSVGTFEYTGVPDVIANDHGNLSTPSYVAFVGDQQVLVGEAAYDQANTNPKNTVFGVNRFIGRMFEDKIVQEQIENVPFSVVNVGGWPMIEVENRKYSSKEICSMTLSKLKQTAESYLANKVTEAVITVPDYFNDSQRKAVKDAASTVGLTVLRFISESETVAIAYELDKLKESERKNVLILELNHEKTLNASIVDCDNGLKVLASKSANIVKGEDNLTDKIVNWLLRKIQQVSIMATDPLEDHIYNDYLRCICKIAKRAFLNNLSFSLNSTEVFRYDYFDNYHHSYFSPREFKFSTIVMDTFKSTEQLISDVLENTTLNITDIDAVILVGQTTRVFEFDPFFITNFINHNVNIYESIPHDKVFAFGATVQAANMQNEYCTIDRFFRSDCTPLNIGIVLEGGIVCPVIERGTIIPTKKSKIINFSEYSSHIQIYEGQCQFFHDSFYIEKLYISLFRTETIEVTFEIDITGTLIVSANAYNQSIEITNVKRRRTRAEIELMWEYAEQHRVKNEYVRKIIGCLDKNVETIKLDFAFACSASEDADIELPKLLKSSVPQTLNIKIEKLLQEIRHEVANCEYNLVNYLPFNAVINSLTNARDILNRYSLTKNEFDSIFVNEQQVILEIFEQAVFWIRELMLDFLFEFYNIETNKELISSHSEIRIHIQDNVLLQMRSIQSLLILLVKVLWDKQTLFFECSSYFGMFQNPDTIKCKDTKFEIIESTLTSIQQTIETKAIKLLQALDASSVNSPQITKVVYILKNVLFNYGSDAKLGNITFTNDESVTKHGDVDVNKLDKALIEMKKILLELTATTTDIHSVVTGSSQETNAINDVLKQMREIEQLLKTKKFMQNKSSKLGKSSLKKEKVLKKERSSLSLISINEQNFNDAEIIEYFENSEKNETNSHSTDQQTITVDSIEEKYLSNSQSENECIENTKSFNEFNCIVISEESIAQCEIKRDDQTVLHETSLTQTIETAQIFEAIEQEIETNMTEHQQSEPTDDCLNQVETILETEQLLQQAPTSELSNQNKCCCCNLL